MLTIKNLSVKVKDKTIIDNISLTFESGKYYCILGKNGSGKSSFAKALLGDTEYTVDQGEIILDNEQLLAREIHERAKLGLFVSFQHIPEIKGLKLFEFLRVSYNAIKGEKKAFVAFKKIIVPLLQDLNIPTDFLWRDLNVGCSGGEKKKIEIIQIKLLTPKYIILDEIDSGLDVNAIEDIGRFLQTLQQADANYRPTVIIISHNFSFIQKFAIDQYILLDAGKVVQQGGQEVLAAIQEKGFE